MVPLLFQKSHFGRVAMKPQLAVLAAAGLLAAPLGAHAQRPGPAGPSDNYTYRCVGQDGKKYYGSTVPQQCLGQPLELINKQGRVVKRIDHEGEEKARLEREANAEKRRAEEAEQREAARRYRALLATYSSEKEIEDARGRALRENQKQVAEVEARIDGIKKRQARYEQDLELFKSSGKGTPPPRLKEEITNAQIDLKAQQTLLDAKKKEVEGINARYNEDKKNYQAAIASGARRTLDAEPAKKKR
jgi:hypothetical protein